MSPIALPKVRRRGHWKSGLFSLYGGKKGYGVSEDSPVMWTHCLECGVPYAVSEDAPGVAPQGQPWHPSRDTSVQGTSVPYCGPGLHRWGPRYADDHPRQCCNCPAVDRPPIGHAGAEPYGQCAVCADAWRSYYVSNLIHRLR